MAPTNVLFTAVRAELFGRVKLRVGAVSGKEVGFWPRLILSLKPL